MGVSYKGGVPSYHSISDNISTLQKNPLNSLMDILGIKERVIECVIYGDNPASIEKSFMIKLLLV